MLDLNSIWYFSRVSSYLHIGIWLAWCKHIHLIPESNYTHKNRFIYFHIFCLHVVRPFCSSHNNNIIETCFMCKSKWIFLSEFFLSIHYNFRTSKIIEEEKSIEMMSILAQFCYRSSLKNLNAETTPFQIFQLINWIKQHMINYK